MPALKLCPVWAFPGSCELAPDGFHQGGCAVQTLLLSASSLMWGLSLLPANSEAMGAEWNTPNISFKTGHGPIPATATGCQHKSLLHGTLPRSQHPVPGLSGGLQCCCQHCKWFKWLVLWRWCLKWALSINQGKEKGTLFKIQRFVYHNLWRYFNQQIPFH